MKKPKGLTIRKMKEILRLHFGLNLTQAQTAKSLNISAGAVWTGVKLRAMRGHI